MDFFADRLGRRGFGVARFEFPYMATRRKTGGRRPPDREEKLRATWCDVVEYLDAERLIIGGKSLGGRMASLVADQCAVRALICLGYPFHPPGRPERLRTAHLADLRTPCLIVQGSRDPFGTADEVAGYQLASTIRIHWAADGNHDLKPRKASGHTAEENWQEAVDAIESFIQSLPS